MFLLIQWAWELSKLQLRFSTHIDILSHIPPTIVLTI
uniref:Uncharacterized protein n=1 Tax=Arundo donax TaxID=35708 RepID=A0A0A9GT18_ARUDO